MAGFIWVNANRREGATFPRGGFLAHAFFRLNL